MMMTRHPLTFCLLALCLMTWPSMADEASHRKVATELLAQIGGEKAFVEGFAAMAGPVEAAWRQQGVPEDMIPAMRGALQAWVREDFKWSELEPRLVELYVKEFSEPELKELLAFYRTPAGRKAAKSLPRLMQEGAAIGQKYAEEKQSLLVERIQKAVGDRQPAAAPEPPAN